MLKGTEGEDRDPGLVGLLLQWRRWCDSESGTVTPKKTRLPVTHESLLEGGLGVGASPCPLANHQRMVVALPLTLGPAASSHSFL